MGRIYVMHAIRPNNSVQNCRNDIVSVVSALSDMSKVSVQRRSADNPGGLYDYIIFILL